MAQNVEEVKERLKRTKLYRAPWNLGKRKPITDDCGNKWCACLDPKLSPSGVEDRQAYCRLCGNYWYN